MNIKSRRLRTCKLLKYRCALMVAAILTTCPATAQPHSAQAAATDVQNVIAQRTGYSIAPSGNSQADQSVSWCIAQMLTGKVSKDEAVQIALLNNRNLQAQLAEIGIANGDLIDAGLLKNPILDLLYRKSSEPDSVANVEFNVTLDFLDILTLPMRRNVAASEFEETKLNIAHEVLNLTFDVESAFFRLQSAAQVELMYRDAVETSKVAYELAKQIHEAGNITDLNLHQQQAIYEEQKLNLAEAERDAIEKREELNMLMGLWGPYAKWEITPELPNMPSRKFQGKGLESVAVYQRLDLAEARQQIETHARELGLNNATSLIPELGGTFNAERETDSSWLRGGGVSFPIPLFNQGQGRLQSQRARMLQAQHRYYALAVDIRSKVRKAFGQMLKSRDRVQYYDKIMLPLRKRIVEESHLMYNAMELPPSDLLQAKREEILARRDRVEALRDYWLARSELERAMGGSLNCYKCPTATPQNGAQRRAQSAAPQANTSVGEKP